MHVLTISKRVVLGPTDIIEPGRYFTEDISGAQTLVMAGGGTMEPMHNSRGLTPLSHRASSYTDSPQRVMVMRMGGFGDLLLLAPTLREIKRRWPACHLAVSTMGHYAVALENLPFVDAVLPYPVPVEVADGFDAWVFLEGAEHTARSKEIHLTDLFAEIAGVTIEGSKQPAYAVKPSEALWAAEKYPRTQHRRVCVQVGTSAICRTYPRSNLGTVCAELVKRGWEVFLMGQHGEVKTPDGHANGQLRNLCDDALSFRQSAAVVSQCDVLLGSDSALVHVAAALDVAGVALFGPFPWQLRTAYSPSIRAIQGNVGCSPCQHHANPPMGDHFPSHCPTKTKGYCALLADITPERVVSAVERACKVTP